MTPSTLEKEIKELSIELLRLAEELTWNKISGNCRFILSEIKNSNQNFDIRRKIMIKENDKKKPAILPELMPVLQELYKNIYDINLEIYKATKTMTIIDIRYYLKTSLDKDYMQTVLHNPPMLHCKVALPPGQHGKEAKFDINWQHKPWLIKWKLFWLRRD